MPYIDKKDRPKFNKTLNQTPEFSTKGELEYCIFYLMKRYMSTRLKKYNHLHDTAYAAQHCCDEFRRRFLDKREDKARKSNGDIIGVES
jgi:hypothetical protein